MPTPRWQGTTATFVICPAAHVVVGAESGEAALQAEQPHEAAGVIDDREATLTIRDHLQLDDVEGLVASYDPVAEIADSGCGLPVRQYRVKVCSVDDTDQPAVRDNECGVNVVIQKQPSQVADRRAGLA
jgi:hypothetical protein